MGGGRAIGSTSFEASSHLCPLCVDDNSMLGSRHLAVALLRDAKFYGVGL